MAPALMVWKMRKLKAYLRLSMTTFFQRNNQYICHCNKLFSNLTCSSHDPGPMCSVYSKRLLLLSVYIYYINHAIINPGGVSAGKNQVHFSAGLWMWMCNPFCSFHRLCYLPVHIWHLLYQYVFKENGSHSPILAMVLMTKTVITNQTEI